MKIYQIIDKSYLGGGQAAVRNLATGFESAGVPSLLSCRDDGPLVADIEALGIPVLPIPFDKRFRPGPARQIAEIARAENVDIIHAHGLVACFYCALARLLFGVSVPLVYQQHGFHHHNYGWATRWLRRKTEQLVCRHVDHTIACSRFDEKELLDGGYCSSQTVSVIHYGIPDPRPSAEELEEARDRVAATEGSSTVGIVGRLHPQKGMDVFLQAAALIIRERPRTQFVIVGSGELEKSIGLQIAELGLESSVRVLQGRGNVYMPLFDVAVLSSRWEGLPLVLLEYMGNERAIVTTDVPGCREAVNDDQAEIVPIDDAAAIAGKVIDLLDDRGRAVDLASRARKRFESSFTIDVLMQNTLRLYRALVRSN